MSFDYDYLHKQKGTFKLPTLIKLLSALVLDCGEWTVEEEGGVAASPVRIERRAEIERLSPPHRWTVDFGVDGVRDSGRRLARLREEPKWRMDFTIYRFRG
ncbi:ACT-like protein tyrosine kinase family protein [Perilla frutescens var. frutescens]|nr:ACT-like protein tyrosine kinase family protein [Perilla frutescens var. frutescens]